MRMTIYRRAGAHERYAAEITLPEPGSLVPVRDRTKPDAPIIGTATVVRAWRESDTTLALEVDVDAALAEGLVY